MPASPSNGLQLAKWARTAVEDKKALTPVILDLRGISSLTDYFLIAGADSEPQLRAMAESVREALREKGGERPLGSESPRGAAWIALDYGQLVVHLMLVATREHYRLEDLWKDAKRVRG